MLTKFITNNNSNLLLHTPVENGRIIVKICDFGLSSLVKDRRETLKTFCGSPIYAAPEINRFSYSMPVDVYSLGITALEMLCGIESKEFHTKMYSKTRDHSCVENVINRIPLQSLRTVIRLMVEYDEKERISIEELLTHPVIQAFEAVILGSRGLLNVSYLENSSPEFVKTIFELAEFYKNDETKFELMFQTISQIFEFKPSVFIDVIDTDCDEIFREKEFLFLEGNTIQSNNILFVLIASLSSKHKKEQQNLIRKENKGSFYDVFKDSIIMFSDHTSTSCQMYQDSNQDRYLMAHNVQKFVIQFLKIAGERYQNAILSFSLQLLMQETSINGTTKAFCIDDQSFIFTLVHEMVTNFDICKQAVFLKGRPLSTTTTSPIDINDQKLGLIMQQRTEFLHAVHQQLLSGVRW